MLFLILPGAFSLFPQPPALKLAASELLNVPRCPKGWAARLTSDVGTPGMGPDFTVGGKVSGHHSVCLGLGAAPPVVCSVLAFVELKPSVPPLSPSDAQ